MFTSILDSAQGLTAANALFCTAAALALGFVVALVYMAHGRYTKSFVITLVVLPVLVQAVIMMVNGNLGTGVAVLGAFSLIRFRSVPGSAREITCIFFSMAIGLAAGMGYLTFAAMMTAVIGAALFVLFRTPFGEKEGREREVRITIPENLDYTGAFDDIFARFAVKASLERVKTVNLGSLFELQYHVELKDLAFEKEMIDEIRCRNGNLTIVCGRPQVIRDEL